MKLPVPEQVVTAIYRLKDIGHDQALRALIREHVPVDDLGD